MMDIINNKYMSNTYGPFNVIGYVKPRYYLIKFEWSNCITSTRIDHIRSGTVRDPWYGINPYTTQWSNKYGPFIITELAHGNNHSVEIQFTKTDTIKNTTIDMVRAGSIKDPSANEITHLDTSLLQPNLAEYRINMFLSRIYKNIMNRCYNPRCNIYNRYGAIGVRICDRWKNSIKNFKEDVKKLHGYSKFYRWPTRYQLDKDFKQMGIPRGERVYGPDTCVFLYNVDNVNVHVFEDHCTNIDSFTSKYYGVCKISNNRFTVHISLNGKNKYLGTYTNEIAAANVYNHYSRIYNSQFNTRRYEEVQLSNNVPLMSLDKCMQFKVSNRKDIIDSNTYDIAF